MGTFGRITGEFSTIVAGCEESDTSDDSRASNCSGPRVSPVSLGKQIVRHLPLAGQVPGLSGHSLMPESAPHPEPFMRDGS